MARYYKIDKTKDRDTDVILVFLKNEKTGEYVSKYYKTVIAENYQSFVMLNGKEQDFLNKISEKRTGAVEITAEEFCRLSEKLKEDLC